MVYFGGQSGSTPTHWSSNGKWMRFLILGFWISESRSKAMNAQACKHVVVYYVFYTISFPVKHAGDLRIAFWLSHDIS